MMIVHITRQFRVTLKFDGDVLDTVVRKAKDKQATLRFLKKLMKSQGRSPKLNETIKLSSYGQH
jgi:transposase-like protein